MEDSNYKLFILITFFLVQMFILNKFTRLNFVFCISIAFFRMVLPFASYMLEDYSDAKLIYWPSLQHCESSAFQIGQSYVGYFIQPLHCSGLVPGLFEANILYSIVTLLPIVLFIRTFYVVLSNRIVDAFPRLAKYAWPIAGFIFSDPLWHFYSSSFGKDSLQIAFACSLTLFLSKNYIGNTRFTSLPNYLLILFGTALLIERPYPIVFVALAIFLATAFVDFKMSLLPLSLVFLKRLTIGRLFALLVVSGLLVFTASILYKSFGLIDLNSDSLSGQFNYFSTTQMGGNLDVSLENPFILRLFMYLYLPFYPITPGFFSIVSIWCSLSAIFFTIYFIRLGLPLRLDRFYSKFIFFISIISILIQVLTLNNLGISARYRADCFPYFICLTVFVFVVSASSRDKFAADTFASK